MRINFENEMDLIHLHPLELLSFNQQFQSKRERKQRRQHNERISEQSVVQNISIQITRTMCFNQVN